MTEILPRFYRRQQELEDMQRIGQIILETGKLPPEASGGRPLRASADGQRSDRMRGLPIIARGIGGTAPGTDPAAELLRRENGRRRR